jgi:hypothetical protein
MTLAKATGHGRASQNGSSTVDHQHQRNTGSLKISPSSRSKAPRVWFGFRGTAGDAGGGACNFDCAYECSSGATGAGQRPKFSTPPSLRGRRPTPLGARVISRLSSTCGGRKSYTGRPLKGAANLAWRARSSYVQTSSQWKTRRERWGSDPSKTCLLETKKDAPYTVLLLLLISTPRI